MLASKEGGLSLAKLHRAEGWQQGGLLWACSDSHQSTPGRAITLMRLQLGWGMRLRLREIRVCGCYSNLACHFLILFIKFNIKFNMSDTPHIICVCCWDWEIINTRWEIRLIYSWIRLLADFLFNICRIYYVHDFTWLVMYKGYCTATPLPQVFNWLKWKAELIRRETESMRWCRTRKLASSRWHWQSKQGLCAAWDGTG
jgi:hypothetical protein